MYRDGYFYSSAVKSQNQSVHIGQYRVRFDYCKCDQASVVAQQIKDHDGKWTFRKWNPYKKNVPYGVSTDADSDSENSSLVFCCVCIVVDKCMNTMFEEVVNHFVDGIETA